MTDYVLTGLVKRRAEIAGEIGHLQEQMRQRIADLEALDATIGQFDPGYRIESIKPKAFRPPSDWAKRGEMSRVILGILRQAAEPLTTRDVALEMLVSRALDKDDQRLLKMMTKRVGVALRLKRDDGIVRSAQGPGMFQTWEIVR